MGDQSELSVLFNAGFLLRGWQRALQGLGGSVGVGPSRG